MTDDDVLLESLRATLGEMDAVPPYLVQAAQESFTWRTIDAELAEIAADTAVEAAAVRSPAGLLSPRLLTFTVGETTIVVEVTEEAGAGTAAEPTTYRLQGQVVPTRTAVVEVRHARGSLRTEADAYGRFSVDGVPHGPVSLRIEPADGSPVVTSWVPL